MRIIVWYDDGHTEECPTPDQRGWRAVGSSNVVCVQVLYELAYKGKYYQEILIADWGTGNVRWWVEATGGAEWYVGLPDDMPPGIPAPDIKTQGTADRQTRLDLYNQALNGVSWP